MTPSLQFAVLQIKICKKLPFLVALAKLYRTHRTATIDFYKFFIKMFLCRANNGWPTVKKKRR